MKTITLAPDKKVYFASDQHFGLPDYEKSLVREKIFVQWLDEIKNDAQVLFLVGDLFDFWFEYNKAVPKYFVRILGKLAELADLGIQIIFFTGNHDMWMKNYLQEEIGMEVYFEKQEYQINGKRFYIAHGDGLGPGDKGYKRMKKIFRFPFFNWCFKWLHPDLGIALGEYLSRSNKAISGEEDVHFLGEEKEWLILYSKMKLEEEHRDYFIYGHRHLPMQLPIGEKASYINLGDWITYFSYVEFDGEKAELKYLKENSKLSHLLENIKA